MVKGQHVHPALCAIATWGILHHVSDHTSILPGGASLLPAVSTLAAGLQSEGGTATIDAYAASTTLDTTDVNSAADQDLDVIIMSESGSELELLAEEDVIYKEEALELRDQKGPVNAPVLLQDRQPRSILRQVDPLSSTIEPEHISKWQVFSIISNLQTEWLHSKAIDHPT